MEFYVCILTNKPHGTLYIGVTSNIHQRVEQHKRKVVDGFTKKYNLTRVVHIEKMETAYDAISREKQLKNWRRQWKIELIETNNPQWRDLTADL